MLAISLKIIQKFTILISSIATTTCHNLSSCFNIYVDRFLHSSQRNSLKICPLISRLCLESYPCLPQNKTQPPYNGLCKSYMIWSLLVPLTLSLASVILTLFQPSLLLYGFLKILSTLPSWCFAVLFPSA